MDTCEHCHGLRPETEEDLEDFSALDEGYCACLEAACGHQRSPDAYDHPPCDVCECCQTCCACRDTPEHRGGPMMARTYTHYALLQIGGPIYGVGTTEADARDDAIEWLDPQDPDAAQRALYYPDLSACAQAVDGDLVVTRITRALYDRVRHEGTTAYRPDPAMQGYHDVGEDDDLSAEAE